MKKRNKFLIIVGVIMLLTIICVAFKYINSKNDFLNYTSNNTVIMQYKPGTESLVNKINIQEEDDITELKEYIKKIKPLNDSNMVQLALLNEIEIQYNDYVSIYIQLGERDYCYYINSKENISSLAMMPKGLYEWVENKIQ